jgi:hypothetical protein
VILKNLVYSLLLIIMTVSGVAAQTTDSTPVKVITVPRTVILPVVVNQPGCPMRLEHFSFVGLMEGSSGSPIYSFKYTGIKPLKSYSIAWLTISGAGSVSSYRAKNAAEEIQPNESINNYYSDPGRVENVPLTDELRKKLKIDGPMQGLVILMIVRLDYADGTNYSDEATYRAFEEYLGKLKQE